MTSAAQESEGGGGEQLRDGHGEKTGARDDNTMRGMKRTREDDEGRAGYSRRRKEQAAEQGCRRTMMAHNAHTTQRSRSNVTTPLQHLVVVECSYLCIALMVSS